ncbi:MAG TPA: tRNA (adenosine(37)-N6)-dimethylallyltransferase MiaA [Puia sp.]|nr:tRNA (adenosine(37)-N6)-dimethylallyltransferase MiaA [Puia sp.]
MNQPTVIVIAGPTAVGKTAAAIRLAQSLHTEIISADSRQCFTELNIGVAKPTPEELQAVHHYFINSHSIRQEVNAALFEELALQWTDEIFRKQVAAGPSAPGQPGPLARPAPPLPAAPHAPVTPASPARPAPAIDQPASSMTSPLNDPSPAGAPAPGAFAPAPAAPGQPAVAPAAPAALLLGQPTAVMVGGTGLYIKAFCEGLDEIPSIRPGIREQVLALYVASGIEGLQHQVKSEDPAFYTEGEIHNPQRLMRALEVVRSTGQSILSFRNRPKQQRPFRIKKIGLHLPKEGLHQRIHDRVDQMMDQGLLEEVKSLLPYKEVNALQTVGYRELFDYLDGKCSLSQAVDEIKKNTRHYAKRQMTWFRKDPSIQWVDAREFGENPIKFVSQP